MNISSKNISCHKNYTQNVGPASSVVQRRASIRIEKKLVKNCTVRETFFTNRIAKNWNMLSDEVIEARTVNGFMGGYDKYINEQKATIA